MKENSFKRKRYGNILVVLERHQVVVKTSGRVE